MKDETAATSDSREAIGTLTRTRACLVFLGVLTLALPGVAAAGWVAQTSPTTKNLNGIHVLDANTVFVVGDDGTILKTTNGGSNWVALTSGTTQPLYAVHFQDANNGWAVGAVGTIIKTTDGGNSWTLQNTGAPATTLQGIRFVTPSIGMAAGTVGSRGILRTTDGGQTWAEQSNMGPDGTNRVQGLFFVDSLNGWAVGLNASTITTTCDFFGCTTSYNNAKLMIWKTTDGGATWTVSYSQSAQEFFQSASFIDASTGWVVGGQGRVVKTTNGGATWVAQSSGTSGFLYSGAFVNATTGWIVGADGIRKTTDGGATWAVQGTFSTIRLAFADSVTGWTIGSSGKILKTTDAGGPVCTYTLSPTSRSFSAGSGSGSLTVTTTANCSWTASSDATWLTISSGTSGSGSGTISYSVGQNPAGVSRTGHITIGGQTFTVEQAACSGSTYTLSPTSSSLPGEGGRGSFSVTVTGACGWTATSDAAWLTITSGASGTTSGTVAYSAGHNSTGTPRTGHITVQGQMLTVEQPACGATCAPLIVTTFAGALTFGTADGTGSAARFYNPAGVAVDGVGNIYVADKSNNRIRKISPDGVVTTLAGSTLGNADGTGAAARFYYPSGVAVDGSGNVYVADTLNGKIRKVTPAGEVTTLASGFSVPQGVVLDPDGNVYVAESYTIKKVTPAGVVTTLAGSAGQIGTTDGTGSAARFNTLAGIARDASGNLYVADQQNGRIRKVTPAGVVTTLVTGLVPSGVAVDRSGTLYVTHGGTEILRIFLLAGGQVSVAGLVGTSGSADGTGTAARFNSPFGVAVDGSGNVYVGDSGNNTIRKGTCSVANCLAGVPAQIALHAGNNQSATAGTAVAIAPAVIVRDSQNNPVSGVGVTFVVASGGGSVTGASPLTGSDGVAAVGGWTLGGSPGTKTLTATAGDLAGSPVTFTATGTSAAAVAIQIASSPNPSTFGQSVTFTATVTPSAATGTVNFKEGSTTLGSGTLSSGTASFSTSTLSVGTHAITAQYTGDSSFGSSVSSAVSQVVDSPPGVPSLSIDDRPVQEGAAINAAFRLALSAPSSQTVTVQYATADGTAVAGSDYTNTSGTVTFTPGRTNQSIYVPIVTDTAAEGDEVFYVNLSNASNAAIADGEAVGTISDPPAAAKIAMYRTYNKSTDYHFFTTALASKNFAVDVLGFQDESTPVPFYVWNAQQTGTTPLYRMYNPNLGRHFYTASSGSRDFIMSIGGVYEKEEGFVFPLSTSPVPAGATELFLLYNNNSGTHLFTADAGQKNAILGLFPGVWVEHTSVGFVFTSP